MTRERTRSSGAGEKRRDEEGEIDGGRGRGWKMNLSAVGEPTEGVTAVWIRRTRRGVGMGGGGSLERDEEDRRSWRGKQDVIS